MAGLIKVPFKKWTLDSLDDAFKLKQVRKCEVMQAWESMEMGISDYEKQVLADLQEGILRAGKAWNEVELENKFISPLITFAKIDNDEFCYFLERDLEGDVGNYHLSGTVDGMIATGTRTPKVPFFCMHEYKRSVDNEGNPDGQALAAMLVAREHNKEIYGELKPIYGLYVVGLIWNFIVLNGNEYCISKNYDSSKSEIFDIFNMVKAIRKIIETKLM